jgi:hypothetical protein
MLVKVGIEVVSSAAEDPSRVAQYSGRDSRDLR